MNGPLVLAVLDGWGCRTDARGNAILAADLPNWRAFFDHHPWTTLQASGIYVGLPPGIMGNSEVGHMNLGSGRVVPQGVTVIDADIAAGRLPANPVLVEAFDAVRESGGTLHFMGLLSDGQVHSSIEHLFALVDAAVAANVPFVVDAFLDGRDTPPRSALAYIAQLESHLAKVGRQGAIATVCGRFYAMDRDKRAERTQRAFDLLSKGEAEHFALNASDAVHAAYARDENDEFVAPTTIGAPHPVRDGDAVVFFNFRPDRARQLTIAFNREYRGLLFATMTRYDETFPNPVLFGPRPQFDTFGEIVSRAGLRQLRLAETEKYAHVTYFFNGGREDIFENEERELIPSDRSVETYDLAPAMRAAEITDAAIAALDRGIDVVVMNYANADMVGHTGKWEPTIESVEVLDACLGRLSAAVLARGGLLALTADHGNAEEKIDADGDPLTAHTTNPVPLVLVGSLRGRLDVGGCLGDVAPTLLRIAGLPVPAIMTGRDLFHPDPDGVA